MLYLFYFYILMFDDDFLPQIYSQLLHNIHI